MTTFSTPQHKLSLEHGCCQPETWIMAAPGCANLTLAQRAMVGSSSSAHPPVTGGGRGAINGWPKTDRIRPGQAHSALY